MVNYNNILVNTINELVNTNIKILFKELVLRKLLSNYQQQEKVALIIFVEELKEDRNKYTWYNKLNILSVLCFQYDLIS